MNAFRVLAVILAIAAPAVATAQWRWTDKNGHAVYSDQPPPADIPASSIQRQPGGRAQPAEPPAPQAVAKAASAAAPAAPARPGASGAKAPTGKDKELLERKKQAQAAEEEKKKAEEEEAGRARSDNCERAKRSKAMFASGARVARMNDKGEREILDDRARAAETRRLEDIIARDCKPAGG